MTYTPIEPTACQRGRCEGCGAELPDGARKWCSESCRKEQYKNMCACGNPCWGECCESCARVLLDNRNLSRKQAQQKRWDRILAMREEGMLNYEISDILKVSALLIKSDIPRMKNAGMAVPESTYDRNSWVWRGAAA